MDQLSGKTAVVTGAASGMGRSFALRFARAQMNVVLADVDMVRLAEVEAEVKALSASVITVETDVRPRRPGNRRIRAGQRGLQ
jgi:NADP-dependent 3-hydroxy acid dehydrogenase YdfG